MRKGCQGRPVPRPQYPPFEKREGWVALSCDDVGKDKIKSGPAPVFRAEPMAPIEGMAIVTRVEGELPKLPPHLGTWQPMDASENTIRKAFIEMGVPVSSSRQSDLPVGTIGICFGPEPGPQTIELPLLLSNCEPAGESCDVVAGSTETHGSFITTGNARQVIRVTRPMRVLFQADTS